MASFVTVIFFSACFILSYFFYNPGHNIFGILRFNIGLIRQK